MRIGRDEVIVDVGRAGDVATLERRDLGSVGRLSLAARAFMWAIISADIGISVM